MAKPVIFGEVLFDHFPDDSQVLGGAPFNVAWHLQAFGMEPLFISRVGDDELGRRVRYSMRDWGMDVSGLQMDSTNPTGTVEIEIENGEPSYEIVIDQAYDFIDENEVAEVTDGALLYEGSLIMRNLLSREALNAVRTRLDLPVFVDVNLRDPWWDRYTVSLQLEAAQWVKLNSLELHELSPIDGEQEDQMKALQEACELSLLIVTLGEEGALARTADGTIYRVEPQTNTSVVDVVGAGDAFSSVILFGLLSGWDMEMSLKRATTFASAVVGIRGATPSHKNFYKPYIENWSKT
ncbi:MAG: carbohydrate kinase [Methylococcales bacterium]